MDVASSTAASRRSCQAILCLNNQSDYFLIVFARCAIAVAVGGIVHHKKVNLALEIIPFDMTPLSNELPVMASLAPWLTVGDGDAAVEFYRTAFGAVEVYRLDTPDGGLISRLKIGEHAEFWLSSDASVSLALNSPYGIEKIRMILTVPNPDNIFRQATYAGANIIFPVEEQHGWRIGRIEDPFGFHWEIGRPVQTP